MRKIPRNVVKEHKDEREDFAQALASQIISITNIKDANDKILLYKEKQDLIRWISRGREIVSNIDPTIFRQD